MCAESDCVRIQDACTVLHFYMHGRRGTCSHTSNDIENDIDLTNEGSEGKSLLNWKYVPTPNESW